MGKIFGIFMLSTIALKSNIFFSQIGQPSWKNCDWAAISSRDIFIHIVLIEGGTSLIQVASDSYHLWKRCNTLKYI